jgi:hypothetical protein
MPGVTCLDIQVYNAYYSFTTQSGEWYWIKTPSDTAPYRVYCDFSTDGGGWTLIESMTSANGTGMAGVFQHFVKNTPSFEGVPDKNYQYPVLWYQYRLGLTKMQNLITATTRWRATCNAHQSISDVMNKDYVIIRHSNANMMINWNSCALADKVSVRAITCTACNVMMRQGFQSPANDHLYLTTYYNGNCGAPAMSTSGSISLEMNFGYYTTKNTAFTCSATSASTTNVSIIDIISINL